MLLKDGVPTFHAPTQQAWREWLEANHQKESSVWLIIYKKASPVPSVTYSEAVDEALCFGWIDSKPNKRDDESFFQYFARRNPRSNWSRVNKEKVQYLIAQGRMAPAGLDMVVHAQKTGTWDALNEVEDLIVPAEMQALFDQNPLAFQHWQAFPRTVQRGILEWIFNAKRPETRQKRIEKTVSLAAQNIRANF